MLLIKISYIKFLSLQYSSLEDAKMLAFVILSNHRIIQTEKSPAAEIH